MKILIACEFSEIVKEAFLKQGHDAHSCDLLPGEKGLKNHHQCDVLPLLKERWDGLIAHPPCKDLAVSGARWFKFKQKEQQESINFFMEFWNSGIKKICIENPIGIMSTAFRKPDQIIQPYEYGHGETKATCLWLKKFPLLKSTKIVKGRVGRVWRESPGPDRWKNRSRTYQGIADAMAEQWS